MSTSITVLSWNIESLGKKKATVRGTPPQASEIVNFIQLAVSQASAGVVAIMEVKGGIASLIFPWLVALLNNARPPNAGYAWDGRFSSRQDGGTKEEYLVLWQSQTGVMTLDPAGIPGPTSLVGVVDDRVMEGLYRQAKWTVAQQQAFIKALTANKYVVTPPFGTKKVKTKWPRVVPAAWQTLSTTNPPTVTFAPKLAQPPALTPAQLAALPAQLLNIDILRFTSNADRPPYLVNLLLGSTPLRLMLAVLHNLGPSDPDRVDAINVIGLSQPMAAQVAQQDSLLVMGDFNMKAKESADQAVTYGRQVDKAGAFTFAPLSPIARATVFSPITGNPLQCTDLLGPQKTSLINGYIADSDPAGRALANAYDKFFFHGGPTAGPQLTAAGATVRNLVTATASDQGSAYSPALGTSVLRFFRAFRGNAFLTKQTVARTKAQAKLNAELKRQSAALKTATQKIDALGHRPSPKDPLVTRKNTLTKEVDALQNALNDVSSQLLALKSLQAMLATPTTIAPTGIGTALSAYRYAVSDHLPISVQLSWQDPAAQPAAQLS